MHKSTCARNLHVCRRFLYKFFFLVQVSYTEIEYNLRKFLYKILDCVSPALVI